MKRTIALFIAMILCLAVFGGCNTKSGPNDFTYFLFKGNTKYDIAYKQNAVAEVMTSQEWLGEKLSLEFMVPSKSSSATETMQTIIASGDYPDIIDYNALNTYTLQELYEDGIILDLTEYVEAYMPNYTAYLSQNPDLRNAALRIIDGEERYLSLSSFDDITRECCWGYTYRRDWIAKYGKNPFTGEDFTGGYNEKDEWEDDVVFPNGENVPIYLSDWEWMFEIFERAREDLGITDDPNSYSISIPFSGVDMLGGLCGAFNTNSAFYLDNEGVPQFGGTSENIRVYFDCVSSWYEKGWLDKSFYERASDQPYAINRAGVASGKVGMWYGSQSYFAKIIRDGSNACQDGAYAMACRPPLNDIYGKGTSAFYSDENPFINNNCYTYSRWLFDIVISVSAKDKNLPALFTMLDSMYTEEMAIMHDFGFKEEQQRQYRNQFYIDNNITHSWEYAVDENGKNILNEDGKKMIKFVDEIKQDEYLYNESCTGIRLFGKAATSMKYVPRDEFEKLTYKELMNYEGHGYITDEKFSLMSAETISLKKNIESHIRNEGETILYRFVIKDPSKNGLDASNEKDWNEWTKVFDQQYKNEGTVGEVMDRVLTDLRIVLSSK